MNKNPNCDGDSCMFYTGEVRLLPISHDTNCGNLILCAACFKHEIEYRRVRNKELGSDCQFDVPMWNDLEVYGSTVTQ